MLSREPSLSPAFLLFLILDLHVVPASVSGFVGYIAVTFVDADEAVAGRYVGRVTAWGVDRSAETELF